jgi:hypothetical protein
MSTRGALATMPVLPLLSATGPCAPGRQRRREKRMAGKAIPYADKASLSSTARGQSAATANLSGSSTLILC